MIPVTRPHLPNREKYFRYIERCYENRQLTNNGPLVRELKERLEDHLGVQNLLPVANGTLALQIAYRTLNITGKAITTPFTFVATSSSLQWEGIQPVFADIDAGSLNLDPSKAEMAIDEEVSAIVPVHVYGNPCDVGAFDDIVKDHEIKVIYDAAHAFGVRLKGRSVLNHGDAATLSFHATKVFHSVEGGAIIFKRREDYERACRLINFGYEEGEVIDIGINAKMSEFHAAMGLCMLDEIDIVMRKRKRVHDRYVSTLGNTFDMPSWNANATRNYAYFPVLFPSEDALLRCQQTLNAEDIFPRRYFYPSLDSLRGDHVRGGNSISQDAARRVLCLPLLPDLPEDAIDSIASTMLSYSRPAAVELLEDDVNRGSAEG